jgi:hypothetical protein
MWISSASAVLRSCRSQTQAPEAQLSKRWREPQHSRPAAPLSLRNCRACALISVPPRRNLRPAEQNPAAPGLPSSRCAAYVMARVCLGTVETVILYDLVMYSHFWRQDGASWALLPLSLHHLVDSVNDTVSMTLHVRPEHRSGAARAA